MRTVAAPPEQDPAVSEEEYNATMAEYNQRMEDIRNAAIFGQFTPLASRFVLMLISTTRIIRNCFGPIHTGPGT